MPLRTECCDLEGGLHALAFQSPRTAEAFFPHKCHSMRDVKCRKAASWSVVFFYCDLF